MHLENTFIIPLPADQAWPILLDLDLVVPCLPGAKLTDLDEDNFTGQVKIKLGAIQMAYRGEGKIVEKDQAGGRVVLDVRGAEERGSGTASALVTANLTEDSGTTTVRLTTDLAVTGRAAQFGRGILADVSTRIIDQFADNLATQLTTTDHAATAPDNDATALDLGAVAWPALAKRVAAPAVIGVLLALAAWGYRRRRRVGQQAAR